MSNFHLVSSILKGKCPKCRKGKVFKNSAFSFSFLSVNKHCEVCGADLEPETGFYYGAMYFNYAIQVALMIAVLVAINVIFGISPYYYYIIATTTIVIFCAPLTGRLSRLLMLYIFGGHKYSEKENKELV
ncbi:MAG: DUF983 domain-containing protein [Cytophagales bacterium]